MRVGGGVSPEIRPIVEGSAGGISELATLLGQPQEDALIVRGTPREERRRAGDRDRTPRRRAADA